MSYRHTQKGPIHYILFAVAVGMVGGAWLAREEPAVSLILSAAALLTAVFAFSFQYLVVEDEGECLTLRYGPLPLFRKRIRYADVTAVERGRSTVLDGWGIHYLPGRGWTYNLWGFDCARLTLGRRVIRVGSDDCENLVEFLRARISAAR